MRNRTNLKLALLVAISSVVLAALAVAATLKLRDIYYARIPRTRLVLRAQPQAVFEFSVPELSGTLPQEQRDDLYAQIATRLAPEALGTPRIRAIDLGPQRLTLRTLANDDDAVARQAQKAQALLADLFPDARPISSQFLPATPEDLASIRTVLQARLRDSGLARALVHVEPPDRVVVEIPVSGDPERPKELIRQTAVLEFRDIPRRYAYGHLLSPEVTDAPGGGRVFTFRGPDGKEVPASRVILESPVILTGSDLKPNSARVLAVINQETAVVFTLAPASAEAFEDFTRKHIDHYLAVVLDGEMITCPIIMEPIPGGEIHIAGGFDEPDGLEQARDLKVLLNAGALPFDLEYIEARPITGAD